jgi:transposase
MEGDRELGVLTQLLDLKEFEVVAAEGSPQQRTWTVVWNTLWVCCEHCGRVTGKRHACDERLIQDLPMGERSLVLVVRQFQFECDNCGKYFTPPCGAIAPGTYVTERLLARMAEMIKHSDIASTAAHFGIPEKTLEGWYYDYVERQRQKPRAVLRPIHCLGIDEISPKKKHRQFCVVLIDHGNGRVLDLLEGRDKGRLVQWLKEQKEKGVLGELQQVTLDMWGPYVGAVQEVFGEAVKITVDRFHVAAQFGQRMDEARCEIQRRLPPEAAAELKGTRWLWLKNEENLTEEEVHRRRALMHKYPELGELVRQRESLREIFANPQIRSVQVGVKRLRRWCERAKELGLRSLNAFVGTMERWMDRIANYFVDRSTNARTEGFNHGIRGLLWRACGMRNMAHLRARVLHAFG